MTLIQRYDLTEDVETGFFDITPVPERMEGRFISYEDYAVLQDRVHKLTAENSKLIGWVEMDSMSKVDMSEFDATDAVIHEIQSKAELEGMVKGAGRVALEASQVYRVAPHNSDERSLHKTIGNFAHMVARRIRAGDQP